MPTLDCGEDEGRMRAGSWQGITVRDLAGPDLPLRQRKASLSVRTEARRAVDLTGPLADWLRTIGAGDGLLTLFLRHTSAALTVQENTDPDVLADLGDALDRMAPERMRWRHDCEGPDDMPAHVKTSLLGVSLAIPVEGGRMALGTWQTVYCVENRASPHGREVALHYVGT